MSMFCYQCQETTYNTGCTIRGVCGKSDDVAALQDLLLYLLKGIAVYDVQARPLGISDDITDIFVVEALFATLTNVNFDPDRLAGLAHRAIALRDHLREQLLDAYREQYGRPFAAALPEMATWYPENGLDSLVQKGQAVGILSLTHPDPDINSLREIIIYGLKGLAAYYDHAAVLGALNTTIPAFLYEALAATVNDKLTINDLIGLALQCGTHGVTAMALLDEANTSRFGHPEPTWVNLGVRPGPGILVTGHDLLDLEELLEQTAGTGINVYTHGEMLPAHAYPAFKKYPHLVGNYGGAWWEQQRHFATFNGPILVTTNCIQKPLASYRDRIFTTGVVAWPDTPHIADRQPGQPKDFSPLIQQALTCAAPEELETGRIQIGFAHATVLGVADQVIAAIESGAIKRFVVMAGCDGRQQERAYYTDVAQSLPSDTIILTAGCAKYRYNKLDLGTIGGIPRVLDAGQCNDCYSLAVIAQKLAQAVGAESINDLPLSFDIAWFEQKAVLVLLSLLSLNVKGIRLGPTLPAFVSPNVLNVLVKTFDLKPISTVEADIAAMMAGN